MRKLLVLSCLCFVGCTTTLNVQRSGLRGIGDTGVTVGLDRVDAEEVITVHAEVTEIAKQLLKFFASGDIANLTQSTLKDRLTELIPPRYLGYFSVVVSAVSSTHLQVDKIGVKNVKRLEAAVIGVLNGLVNYELSDR